MAIFRYENRYSMPSREQRERYLKGEHEEHTFGPGGEIMLIAYDEAIYIKDGIDDVRILFTGTRDKQEAYEEVRRLIERHGRGDEGKE
jgi:hypothetical protein